MMLAGLLVVSSHRTMAASDEFVPDAETAKSIARAVLLARNGPSALDGQEPLIVTRERGVWIVKGAPSGFPRNPAPEADGSVFVYIGGWPEVRISAKDARILKFAVTQ